MNQDELTNYIERYLQAQECTILEKGEDYLRVKLSIQADKDIGGRPYYWMFVERTGGPAETLMLTWRFRPSTEDSQPQGELIQFGCWRLHQIFQSAKKNGRFIRLYEQRKETSPTRALIPWLWINYRLSYVSYQKRDFFLPLGINLVNGQIIDRFDEALSPLNLTPKIPDYHFTMRPIFSISSSLERVEAYIRERLQGEDKTWADQAHQRLDEERDLIHSFFIDAEEEQEMLEKRLAEVEHYRPRIEVEPINVGLLYLHSSPLSKIRGKD